MVETTKENGEASEDAQARFFPRSDWTALLLGAANFLLVTVLGAYTSWRTQDLENRLSTVQTAAQYIEIVADESAPDYAKGMALNAIFDQGIVSKDQLLDAAYRIEDDSLERTMVGQVFYQIANLNERLLAPFGYIEDVKIHRSDDKVFELVIRGWGVDDDGWLSGTDDGRNTYLVVELDNEPVCPFPTPEGVDCEVVFASRPDISAAFSQYPVSEASGFELRLRMMLDARQARHLVVALRDKDHRGRIIYSRCVVLEDSYSLEVGQERRLKEMKYESTCSLSEDFGS